MAVTTQRGSIKEPPQNCLPLPSSSIACQGQLLIGAMVPPTIRELLGRDPHETDKKAEHINGHRYYNTLYLEKLSTSMNKTTLVMID